MLKLYKVDQKPDHFYKFMTPAYDNFEKRSVKRSFLHLMKDWYFECRHISTFIFISLVKAYHAENNI